MTTRLISTTTTPVTLAEAKSRLRVDFADDDADISAMLSAATDMASQHTRRALASSVYQVKLDAFPSGAIRLLWPPVVTVTGVSYVDANGADQTLSTSAYAIDIHNEPGWVLPADTWPTTYPTYNAVTVDYTAGYGADCPDAIKAWILAHVGHMYRNREAATVGSLAPLPHLDALLDKWRVY